MDCIFCEIAKGNIPSKTLYEDNLVRVIMDANPVVDGHALIIPKNHYTDYQELEPEILTHIFDVAKEMGPKMMQLLDAKALTLLVNYGGSQKVKHFHLHLLPDYSDKMQVKRSIEENFQILTK